MVEVFSKQDGPRREDAHIRQILAQNKGIITKLADQLSNGRYSRSKMPRQEPQAEGLIIHIGGGTVAEPDPEPCIRVTPNGRVVAVDVHSGRQLLHFGDIRDEGGGKSFRLAIKANRYIAPLDDDIAEALAEMDGVALGHAYHAGDLAADIGRRLEIAPET